MGWDEEKSKWLYTTNFLQFCKKVTRKGLHTHGLWLCCEVSRGDERRNSLSLRSEISNQRRERVERKDRRE